MDGTKLVAARKRLCWTQERAAEEFVVGLTTIHRWEKGEVIPRGESLLLLREKYGLTLADLGIPEETDGGKGSKSDTISLLPSEHLRHLSTLASHDLFTCLWPLAFQPYCGHEPLQDALLLALKDYDTMHAEIPNHHIKRREALQRLVMLPLAPALLNFNPSGLLEQPMEKSTLSQYALGIAACRELLKSAEHDDFVTALHGVSAYVPPLQAIVKDFSYYRQEAASLVAQALQLKTTLSWHLKSPYQALLAVDEAVTYAQEARDRALLVAVLTNKTWTCYYSQHYQDGLLSSQRAVTLLQQNNQPLPALIECQAYFTYAMMQAKQGQAIASSLHNSSIALTKFSRVSETPAYCGFAPASYPLQRAIVQYDAKQYTEALQSLSQLVHLDSQSLEFKQILPEREAIEVLNYAALAELKNPRRDKEKALHLWKTGALRARALQSEQRFKAVLAGYDIIEALWPNDAALSDLYELTMHW